MKTLLFCTSYAGDPQTWDARYRRWLDFFSKSPVAKDQILIVDDGSPKLPSWRGLKVLRELPDRQPAEKAVLYHFDDNLGRSHVVDYPGWFRSFTFAAVYARKYGFDKVVHVESDSFVFSRRIVDYINECDSGWTTFWCPRWGFPESCIQVIGKDQLDAYAALAAVPYATQLAGKPIEMVLPFTQVRKDFVGDRYGEYLAWLPDKIDYGCQIPEDWPLELEAGGNDARIPSPVHWVPAAAAPGLPAGGVPVDVEALARTPQQPKEITVICVSYRRYKEMPVLVHCLLAQTLQNFRLLVIHDGPDPKMEGILARFKDEYPDVFDFRMTPERYNDYGHSLREIGIGLLDTEYVLITNDDNYYCPRFLEFMFDPIHRQSPPPDIVMCDMVHSHNYAGGRFQPPYRFFETYPQSASVDIGCFIARSALARKAGFRDKGFDGDATYFEDLVRAAGQPRICKLDHVLFVHN